MTRSMYEDINTRLSQDYLIDEAEMVGRLRTMLSLTDQNHANITERATQYITALRSEKLKLSPLEQFMQAYDLSKKEGKSLMCLAEALLRIPDAATMEAFIEEKVKGGDWSNTMNEGASGLMNASNIALGIAGNLKKGSDSMFGKLMNKAGSPFIRQGMLQTMKFLADAFIMGETIEDALGRSVKLGFNEYTHSFDMLGEAARTDEDALRYLQSYRSAIEAIGKSSMKLSELERPTISVKLSALHPRYFMTQKPRIFDELVGRVFDLASLAKDYNVAMTIDAEEAHRLQFSLDIMETVFMDQSLGNWEGFGLAVQAYQKRAPAVIDWADHLAHKTGRRMFLRLVKGAYWDMEIKYAQEFGLKGYPVFTRKVNTDLCYLACAQKLLNARDTIHPQFATHNAHTVAAILEMSGGRTDDFEFQRLYGMGESMYGLIRKFEGKDIPCRVYAPVGVYKDLLPYLVRRLLENGANSSFVNKIHHKSVSAALLAADPVRQVEHLPVISHPKIPLPENIYGQERLNSAGIELNDTAETVPLLEEMHAVMKKGWDAYSLIGGKKVGEQKQPCKDPADLRREIGELRECGEDDVRHALDVAEKAYASWSTTNVGLRSDVLRKAANLMEERRAAIMAILVREGGKILPDAVAELREAVDFCRYYAVQAERLMGKPMQLPGPTGESNSLLHHPRGIFVCIAPWNFPAAIFLGQVVGALVAGNSVIAKPARQTSIIATNLVKLLYEAGIPEDALQLVLGKGSMVGEVLMSDPRVAGVAFTGSTNTALWINRKLASREGPIASLIAETGGQNAMIVDSTALPEQVTDDVIRSAFMSAGQRCSALRVLFIQEEIADDTLAMLKGGMEALSIGDPFQLSTDIGPVIDLPSRDQLQAHIDAITKDHRLLATTHLPDSCAKGSFLAPHMIEIPSLGVLKEEVFGPILHVVRYPLKDLDAVLDSINATGYGLTLGIHSRMDSRSDYIRARMKVGNQYVNRNMIGAVVGVQPFGGEGLSGTGPKAGGPHYLTRFTVERTTTINTAAVGGNTTLLMLDD